MEKFDKYIVEEKPIYKIEIYRDMKTFWKWVLIGGFTSGLIIFLTCFIIFNKLPWEIFFISFLTYSIPGAHFSLKRKESAELEFYIYKICMNEILSKENFAEFIQYYDYILNSYELIDNQIYVWIKKK